MMKKMNCKLAFGVLAGGKSSRMGQNKSRLILAGRPFLEIILQAGAYFSERIVSFSKEETADYMFCFQSAGILTVQDTVSDTGPLEGIRQILLRTSCPACLVTATDMPFLTAAFLSDFASLYRGSGNLALTFEGRPEPLCSIYCRDCLEAIEELQRIQIHRPAALFSMVSTQYVSLESMGYSSDVIQNINDAEEYRKLLR